ncbi:hypothetical protein [Falsirhodobacter sp. 20TX0035]|uniref:hypothetical protein n=1 Tax=Falsirhodobacter sp. 20TX0035 TaxID=3022019 RepID=UPI00232FBD61|nr:hypothetical protein [Falsirhodobacter sp. 20TX0035]MDB6452086.1 hypothetical protein [Falsirhodobacter sp. 20TX0035]
MAGKIALGTGNEKRSGSVHRKAMEGQGVRIGPENPTLSVPKPTVFLASAYLTKPVIYMILLNNILTHPA